MPPSESRPRPIAARTAAAALLALIWLLLPAASARADDPVTLSRTGQITDKVDALGDREDVTANALTKLDDQRGIQLFVTYVRDFSGRSAQDWANATADRNGLGLNDVLLAVATHDRQYAFSVDQDSRISDAQIQEIAATAVEPALRQNDWAGAGIGAANGINAVVAGQPVPAPTITPGAADPGASSDSGGTGTGDLVLPVIAVGGAGALAAYSYTRRKKRMDTRTTPGGGTGQGGWGKQQLTPLPELDKQARHLLVETDDAVRTSTEELGFATAQFGEDAVKPFNEALAYAQTELTAAFKLRQQLDDAFPEDDATKRRMLDEIISRCSEAGRRLDTVSGDFDRLRALEQSAPEALATAERTFRELTAHTSRVQETLTALGTQYAPSALLPVAGHIEQAKDRLVFATTNLNQARQCVDAGDNGKAAVFLRAAEGAVDQAGTFTAAIERLAGELAEAKDKLPAALTESETDLADARGLLEGTGTGVSTADLRGRIARAESVLGDVRREMGAGPYDPIDALRRVEEADTALDEALAAAREREAGTTRARSLLGQALLTARSSTAAAADFITTHRGAVGSEARTRLAEAQRHLANAQAGENTRDGENTDPAAALTEAQQADALARQAQSLAERDVRGYGNPYGGGGRSSGGMGGAVLGGIILGELLGGVGRGMGGGGRGAYGGGGGFGGGGPGSFGGGGTRGRRGGGGRF
ncbi:TPM domain-containing protein [Streptomyces sp. NPDC050085]|uniref:TPM domain-containing protein n=1 Tax=Streptomyces sp. NPDC050085 TaxID=3365600 RepID=UPI0037ADD9AD